MQTDFNRDHRPEAMADVPGVCELPLTRAVVQYRDRQEVAIPGGRIRDIGLALVLDGKFAAAAEVIDLGSATVKVLDLSGELVVLDWVYEPTLDHLRSLVVAAGRGDSSARAELQGYGLRLALRVLDRVGFSPLTRPTLLRLGFRDLCRDLDLHEETSVRFVMGPGQVTRAHLDYDGNFLLFRTLESGPVPELQSALTEAFPQADIRQATDPGWGGRTPLGTTAYQVRFPLAVTMDELVAELEFIRRGFEALLRHFEPTRFRTVAEHVRALGRRSTLDSLRGSVAPGSGSPGVLPSAIEQRAPRSTSSGGNLGSDRVH